MLHLDHYRCLTFDCYGTLIDWERGILAALRPILASHAVALRDEQVLQLYAELESAAEQPPYQRYREVLAKVVEGFSERLRFRATEEERSSLAESVSVWPPFADTAAALQSLARRYRLAIISNIDDDLFAGSAARLGVEFAAVITAEQAGSYKPNQNNFVVALARLGVSSSEVLHVAQSLYHDIAPAKELGLTTVWVNRRHGRPGSGATPPATARPDLEVPDLATLARLALENGR